MTEPDLIERITRSLAFMLRHQPDRFDLELDAHGFADVGEVVRALNERLGEPVQEDDLVTAVHSGDRPRYEIVSDRIRALYGHSIPVEPGSPSRPPEVLFVAIPEQDVDRARRFGLRGGRRRFLHLAKTIDDARETGRRGAVHYMVLTIRALDAWEEGINFYDRQALWLAEEVPTHLLEPGERFHDGEEPLRRPGTGRPPRDQDRGASRRSRRGGGGDERAPVEASQDGERDGGRDQRDSRRAGERGPRRSSRGRPSDERDRSPDREGRAAPARSERPPRAHEERETARPAPAREEPERPRRAEPRPARPTAQEPATPFGAGVMVPAPSTVAASPPPPPPPPPARAEPAPEPAPAPEPERSSPSRQEQAGAPEGGFGAGL